MEIGVTERSTSIAIDGGIVSAIAAEAAKAAAPCSGR
jgi:hypothetical protein